MSRRRSVNKDDPSDFSNIVVPRVADIPSIPEEPSSSAPKAAKPPAPAKPRDLEVGYLVYLSPEGLETEFPLVGETITVGRHAKNHIRLVNREVSKHHAIITRLGGKYTIKDLDSSNGTFVNNRQVSQAKLKSGDTVSFGPLELNFYGPAAKPAGRSSHRYTSTFQAVKFLSAAPQESTHIHTVVKEEEGPAGFLPSDRIKDVEALRADYDKLRATYELSRVSLSLDIRELLQKTLDVAFSLVAADNGVILLVDPHTKVASPHTFKIREDGKLKSGTEEPEIVLSSTIINQVLRDRTTLLISDAISDPRFDGAKSIATNGLRSAMVVPMIANNDLVGVMHIDSRHKIRAFTEKDLQLIRTLAGQAAIAIGNRRLLTQVQDDARAREQLSRFLPPHVVDEMVSGKDPIMKKGRECEASVVFADIRGFTSLSEEFKSTPQEVCDLLNDYFEALTEIVFANDGVLDKFIGDAVMAHWGTLDNDPEAAYKATLAALEFRDAIRKLNERRIAEGKKPIEVGVGVNTGHLVAGYMGARRRLEYTVIGDTVNTASRVCGLAPGDTVIIAESTYKHVANFVESEALGVRQVKGRNETINVYSVKGLKKGAPLPRRGSVAVDDPVKVKAKV